MENDYFVVVEKDETQLEFKPKNECLLLTSIYGDPLCWLQLKCPGSNYTLIEEKKENFKVIFKNTCKLIFVIGSLFPNGRIKANITRNGKRINTVNVIDPS
jgi:hypothetical protein